MFLLGGSVEKEMAKSLGNGSVAVSGVDWEAMLQRMSMSLFELRARTWQLRVDCAESSV